MATKCHGTVMFDPFKHSHSTTPVAKNASECMGMPSTSASAAVNVCIGPATSYGYKVGDAGDRLAPRCAHPLPKTWTDESTYDVDAHAHHMQTYKSQTVG